MRVLFTLIICLFCAVSIFTQSPANISSMPREMRGVWVATVGNIDWPSSPNLSVASLKREANKIIADAKSWGLNTIFLQVRPSSDAIYNSSIEPITPYICNDASLLSQYSSFDALSYWIDKCHENGIELHAWLNPFRVSPSAEYKAMGRHLISSHPEWLISYGGKLYLDPGIPEARRYVLSVVEDIVSRYKVDGVHFDDYFYPYPVGSEIFGDSLSYERYNVDDLSVADWRRKNVTAVISDVYNYLKSQNDWMKFGVSPFGVWRNASDDVRGSKTRAGITNYDILYADVYDWIQRGIVDYVVPQIYWEAGNKAADFDELIAWWANMATERTKIYVGHAVFKINAQTGKLWGTKNEMEEQIVKVRDNEALSGSVFFSYRQFLRQLNGLQGNMSALLYNKFALPDIEPSPDTLSVSIVDMKKRGAFIHWSLKNNADSANVRYFIVYRQPKGQDSEPIRLQNVVGITSNTYWELHPAISRRDRERYVYRVSAILNSRKETGLSERIVVKE
ncbi:MAG: family 10 glycosylhydrolase [Bacteroidia bacterium]|nr:family 10 glycosylhydrolase [Bacteroidia bacterium]